MKKILCLTAALIIMFLLIVPAFAEETETTAEDVSESETAVETESTNTTETTSMEDETRSNDYGLIPPSVNEVTNFFKRLWEYVVENRAELISLAISAVFGYIAYLFRNKFGKTDKKLSKIETISTETSESQAQVISAVNGMIDGYNDINAKTAEMYEYFSNRQAADENYAKVVASMTEASMTVLAILQYVYSNSKNLPQPTKDMVNYMYVKALKDIESDESMKALSESLKVKVAKDEEPN